MDIVIETLRYGQKRCLKNIVPFLYQRCLQRYNTLVEFLTGLCFQYGPNTEVYVWARQRDWKVAKNEVRNLIWWTFLCTVSCVSRRPILLDKNGCFPNMFTSRSLTTGARTRFWYLTAFTFTFTVMKTSGVLLIARCPSEPWQFGFSTLLTNLCFSRMTEA